MFRTVPLSIIRIFPLYTQQACMSYTIAVCTVENSWWWTEKLSETCRVSFQNKNFEKLVHLVGSVIRKSHNTSSGGMNFIIQDLCEFLKQFWRTFVMPTRYSVTSSFTCFVERTSIWIRNVDVLHTGSFPSKPIQYISYNDVNHNNKTQSGNATSNLVHVTCCPDLILAVYRRIPVYFQITGNDLFQILTYAAVASLLTHIRKFIGLAHPFLKLYSPLCSRTND